MGRGLDVDFQLIFLGFGSQVGVENQRKINSKGVEKSDGKRVVAKMSQESDLESWNVREGPVLGPGGGGRGRGKPLPLRVEG